MLSSRIKQHRLKQLRCSKYRSNTRVSAAATLQALSSKVSFALPYRCNFGQQICIVGKGELLGDWNVRNALPMKWTAGDVWVVDLDVPDKSQSTLEYKYIVRDSNGSANRWMDGDNVVLEVPAFLCHPQKGGTVYVNDSWDQSSHDVSVSFEGVSGLPGSSAEAQQQPAVSSGFSRQAQDATPEVQSSPAYDSEMAVLQSSIERALMDLSSAMDQSEDVVEGIQDPAHPNVLEVDRKVAASYNRVMALSKALKASATDLRLPQPPRCFNQRPSWSFERVPVWHR